MKLEYIIELEVIGSKYKSLPPYRFLVSEVHLINTTKLIHGKIFFQIYDQILKDYEKVLNINARINWHLTLLYNLNKSWYINEKVKLFNKYKNSPIAQ